MSSTFGAVSSLWRKLISGIWAALCCVNLVAQTPPLVHYGSADGLPGSRLFDLLIDQNNTLWIASDRGITAFDGITFRSFSTDTAGNPIGSAIRFCQSDDTTGFWVGTHKRGIFYCNGYQTLPVVTGISNSRGLAYTHSAWWVLSNQLIQIDRSTLSMVNAHPGDPWLQLQPRHGGGYTLVGKHLLYEINRLGDTVLLISPDVPIESAYKVGQRTYLLGSKGKLGTWQDGKTSWIPIPDSLYPVQLFRDSYERIWFSNNEKGLFCWENGQVVELSQLLPKEEIIPTRILEDQHGAIWVSTLGQGLFQFHSPYLTRFTDIDARALGKVNRIISTENTLFAAGEKGVYQIDHPNIQQVNALGQESYADIAVARSSLIAAVKRLESNYSLAQKPQEGAPIHVTLGYSLTVRGDTIYTSYYDDLIYQNTWKAGKWPNTVTWQFGEHMLHRTYQLSWYQDELWQATSAGLRILDTHGNVLQYWGFENEQADYSEATDLLAQAVHQCIFRSDTAWVATERGIVILHRKDSTWNVLDRLPTTLSGITSIALDHSNRIWIGCASGVYVFEDSLQVYRFTERNGLPDRRVSCLLDDTNQSCMWIGTDAGIARIDITRWEHHTCRPPSLSIQKVETRNGALTSLPETPLSLDHLDFLHLFILGSHPAEPGPVYFRYLLDGEEVGFSQENHLLLRKIEAGTHELAIQAKTENSSWSKPIHVPFDVKVPWYQTAVFQIGAPASLVVFILLSLLVYQRHRHNLTLRQAENRAELARLQQQSLAALMRPHFVSNIVSAARSSIRAGKQREGDQAMSRLAQLTRANLDVLQQASVSLEEIWHWLTVYLELEAFIRNSDWTYSLKPDDSLDLEAYSIPPMLIQPLVENALVHGLPKQQGHLHIEMHRHLDELIITVRDNGPGIPKGTDLKASKHSLGIVYKRLEALTYVTGRKHMLHFQSENSGTRAELTVPLMHA